MFFRKHQDIFLKRQQEYNTFLTRISFFIENKNLSID